MPKGKPVKPPTGGGSTPVKVTGVSATPLSRTSIYITWNGVPDATEYYVYRNGQITGIIVFPNSYTDNNGISSNTMYTYEVAASIKGSIGLKSDSVIVKTP